MPSRCVFIGDQLSATGWRLAGADCHAPPAGKLPELLRALRGDGQVGLILVTADYARELPQALLAEVLAAQCPRCVVVADARGRVEPPDLTATLKRQLGLAE
jgi:vacuolar-type H+-ATPase subunit F/Vma7